MPFSNRWLQNGENNNGIFRDQNSSVNEVDVDEGRSFILSRLIKPSKGRLSVSYLPTETRQRLDIEHGGLPLESSGYYAAKMTVGCRIMVG